MADRKVLVGDPLGLDHTPWSPGDRLVTPDGEVGLGPAPLRVAYDTPGAYIFSPADYIELGYSTVTAYVQAGGGGGGAGCKGAPGTDRFGGNAGSGGGRSVGNPVLLSEIPSDVTIIVDTGGFGAPGQTVDNAYGFSGSGTNFGFSSFYYGGELFTTFAEGGHGGLGGTSSSQADFDHIVRGGSGDISGLNGGIGGAPEGYRTFVREFPAVTVEMNFTSGTGMSWAGGAGGGGGGVNSGDSAGAGAYGSPGSTSYYSPNGGTVGGTGGASGIDGTDATDVTTGYPIGGPGGGGGGGGSDVDGNGGNGGDGGSYGAGGGGGGGSTNGTGQSGAGGNGGNGIVVLWLH